MNDLYDDIEKTVMLLRNIIVDIPKQFENNKQAIELCEKEIIDLEHVIELTSFSAAKGYTLAKEIQQVRIRRRQLKDENELLTPLVELVNQMKTHHNNLNKVVGDVRRIKEKHERRTYRMRIREDLQEEVVAAVQK